MEIFDAHTHFFGREFYEFQTSLVPGGDRQELLRDIEAGGLEVPAPDASTHRDRWLGEMDKYGVARAVMFASVPPEMPVVGKAAATSGGRLVPYAIINPRIPRTIKALELIVSQFGFRGMLLFPAMHAYGIGDEIVEPALDLAESNGLNVFVHCGVLRVGVRKFIGLDPEFPLDNAHPRDVFPVARAYADVNFIIPHFGAGFFDEVLELGGACPNVYVDTAGSNAWAAECNPPLALKDLFAQTKSALGADRILYGSDSGVFPRGYRADVLSMQKQAMEDAGFTDAEREAVLGGNLSRLIGPSD